MFFLVYFSCRYFESFGFIGDGFNQGLGEQRKVVAWWSASSGNWWGQIWVCVCILTDVKVFRPGPFIEP